MVNHPSKAKVRRRRVFYAILIVFNVTLVALSYHYVTNNFSILIHRKHARAVFAEDLANLRLETPDAEEVAHFDPRKPHPYIGYKSQPLSLSSFGYYQVETNSLGHRSPEVGRKETGVKRIAIVGGSVAFQGANNDTTIIAKIAQLAEKDGHRVEYINAGIISGISDQELAVFVHDLLDLDVDLLIALNGVNDIIHILLYNGRVGWPPFRWDPPVHHENPQLDQQVPSYYPPIPPQPMISEEKMRAVLSNYLGNVSKMAAIAEAFDVKFLGVLQPIRDFVAEEIPGQALDPLSVFYNEVVQRFSSWDEKKHGGNYISLADFFANKRERFIDPMHFEDEGNQEVADYLYRVIKTRRLL